MKAIAIMILAALALAVTGWLGWSNLYQPAIEFPAKVGSGAAAAMLLYGLILNHKDHTHGRYR